MFGLSFGELMVIALVALVIFGPKELPKVMRKVGYWAGKLRRYAFDLRAQSGIDDALRAEGLDKEIAEIRKLARGEVDGVVAATRSFGRGIDLRPPPPAAASADPYVAPSAAAREEPNAVTIDREREYPREGADAYRALPDTAIVYADTLPASPLARDAVYLQDDFKADAPPPAAEGARPSSGTA